MTHPDPVPDPAEEPTTPAGAATTVTVPWHHDLVAGLLAAGLGTAVVLHVRTFPELPDGQPGPALFPSIVGALLVVFGLVLAVRAVLARGPVAASAPDVTGAGRLRALAVVGLVLGYVVLAETLGFLLTMGVLLFLLMWLLGARPLVAVAAAVLTTGAIVLLFQQVLLVPLPTGLLG